MQHAIKIGPEFFSKEIHVYSDHHWAFAREACQNSSPQDCGSTAMTIEIQGRTVTWSNNGRVMSLDEIQEKYLALGASGKNFEGTVGGYGLAKSLLSLCHNSYTVRSGEHLIRGCGGNYSVEGCEFFSGAEFSSVLHEAFNPNTLLRAFRRFFSLAKFSGVVVINGELYTSRLRKGSPRRTFDWGQVFTNKSFENLVVVRIGGIPMFTRHSDYAKGCVVVELLGKSSDVLTSNRDGLKWAQSRELDAFCSELAVDKRSALRQVASVEYFAGDSLGVKIAEKPEVFAISDSIRDLTGSLESKIPVQVVFEFEPDAVVPGSRLGHEFFIRNNLGLKVPGYLRPDGELSEYARGLVRRWVLSLQALFEVSEKSDWFSVGFVFDEDVGACYARENGKHVFYVNPVKVVEQSGSKSRSLSRSWSLRDKGRFLSLAAHEFVHYLGFGRHDEDFSSELTRLMGLVVNRMAIFNKIRF